MGHANHLFYKKDLTKNEIVLKQNGESNNLYIIITGTVSLFKNVREKRLDGDKSAYKLNHVLDIFSGDIFGEDMLFFDKTNKYTVKVTSLKTSVYFCSIHNFQKNFNKAWPMMINHFKMRDSIIKKQVQGIKRHQKSAPKQIL